MAEEKQIIIDVELDTKDFDKEIGQVNSRLEENRKQIRELRKDYRANATEIARLERENRELTQTKRDLIKEQKTEANSLDALRLRLSNLTKERNSLNQGNEESVQRFQQLQKEIRETSDAIKEQEQAGGDYRRNVGNYPFIGEATERFNGLLAAINPTTVAIGAATAAAGFLASAYASTGRGARSLARAQDRLSSATQQFGNTVADLISDDGQVSLLDAALFQLQSQVLGLESAIRSQIVVSLREQRRELELNRLETERSAKEQLDIAEQFRQVRDEERNSLEDRIIANDALAQVIDEREKTQIAFQEEVIENLNKQLQLNEQDLQLQLELKQAEFELADIREEASGFRSEQLANELALAREGFEDRINLINAEAQLQLTNIEVLRSARELDRIESNALLEQEIAIRQQILRNTAEVELEAAGEDARRRLTIEQNLQNELLKLEIERFEKTQKLQIDEIASYGERSKKIVEIKEVEVNEQVNLENAKVLTTEQLNQQLFQSLSILFEQQTALGKAFALVQIAQNSGRAISGAIAAAQSVPFPGNLLAIATGIAAVGAGIKQATDVVNGAGSIGAINSTISPSFTSIDSFSSSPETTGLSNVNPSLLSQFSDQAEQSSVNVNSQVSVVDIIEALDNRAVKVNESSFG